MICHPFAIVRFATTVSLGLALVACGAQIVVPETDASPSDGAVRDGASPTDASSPTACSAPVVVFDSDSDALSTMAFASARDGYVSVAGTRSGAVYAQAYDSSWAAVGARIELPSLAPSDMYGRRVPAVAFEGARGAITYGASVHEVTISPTLELSLVRSHVAEQDAMRYALLGAWPRTNDLGAEHITAITTDGSGWEIQGGRIGRTARSVQNANFYDAAVRFPTTYNEYVVFDTIARRDVNDDVSIRTYTPGHGMMLLGVDRLERGAMFGAPVRVADALWRLHSQSSERSRGLDEEFALVQHDVVTGDTRGRSAIRDAGLVTSAALAIGARSTSVSEAFVAWTRVDRVTANTQQIVAQWGAGGPRSTVLALTGSMRSASVQSAWVDASGARAWVVYALSDPYNPSMPTRRQIFAQCVSR